MVKGRKLTYANLAADEGIHRRYEEAVEEIRPELGRSHPLIINGREVMSPPEFEVRAPFDTGILVGRFQTAAPGLIRAAIAAAKEGFPSWKGRPWEERAAMLRRTAGRLEDGKYLLSALITYECGKNRYEAIAEVGEAVDMLRYHADVYERNRGFVTPMEPESPGARCTSVMQPHGTWAVISPFNFPLSLAAGMAGAALLTGNTVVLKPTSATPFTGFRLFQAFLDGGVPADALQFLTGPGRVFGEAVVSHPDIDGIAFTGSRDAGMWLQRGFSAGQPYPKPVISEMGSKNPVIVTARADIPKAAEGVVKAAFGYSGQKCSAASRVYVQEPVLDRFLAALSDRMASLVIGDPREKETTVSPLIDERAVGTFRDAVAQAEKDGGELRAGGKVLNGGIHARGHFVQPTLVTGLPEAHPLVKRELFVPFLVVNPFGTLPEALEKANDTEYGLTAGIFSEDPEEIAYFFDTIRFGVTYANRRGGATTGAWPGSQSFGGWKGSGSTGKGIGGPYYLLSYLREQSRTELP